MGEDARRGLDRRDLPRRRPRRPTAGSPPCGRRRRDRATTWTTPPAVPARARPARARTSRRRTRARSPTAGRGCRAGRRARLPGRRRTAASGRAATWPAATSCGTSKTRDLAAGVRVDVGAAPCWWCRDRCRRGSERPSVTDAAPRSSDVRHSQLPRARRAPSTAHARSRLASVPTSVTSRFEPHGHRRLGSAAPVEVSSRAAGSSSSSPSAQCSTTVPGVSLRRMLEPKKRKCAGSPTTRPNSASGQRRRRLPSSMPNGATHSAFTGGAMPGTAGMAVSTPT